MRHNIIKILILNLAFILNVSHAQEHIINKKYTNFSIFPPSSYYTEENNKKIELKKTLNFFSKDENVFSDLSSIYEQKAYMDSLEKLKVVITFYLNEYEKKELIKLKEQSEYYKIFFNSLGIKNVIILDCPKKNKFLEEIRNADIILTSSHGFKNKLLIGGELVSADDMIFEKKPLFLLNNVCYSAGSTASDTADIGFVEAFERVSFFSEGFLKKGAYFYAAFYSKEKMIEFLSDFFSKKEKMNDLVLDFYSLMISNRKEDSKIVFNCRLNLDNGYSIILNMSRLNEKNPEALKKVKMYKTKYINGVPYIKEIYPIPIYSESVVFKGNENASDFLKMNLR